MPVWRPPRLEGCAIASALVAVRPCANFCTSSNRRASFSGVSGPLQHGQQVRGAVEGLLRSLDIDVCVPSDAHLCCGSAGTYSISQPALASQLRDNKVAALDATKPDLIVSANIGCISHLAAASKTPVRHWVELLDDMLSDAVR